MVRDKVTQKERKVDALISARAANYKVARGIEVVAWSRSATAPWVEKMHAKHENLEIDKRIRVSKSGLTKPAIAKAGFYNIGPLTLEAACATDWPLVAKLGSQGVFAVPNLKYDCAVVCELGDGKREQIEAPLHTSFSAGQARITLDEFILIIINRPEFLDTLYPYIKGSGEHDNRGIASTRPRHGGWD